MSTVSALVRSVSGFSDCSVTVGNSFTPTWMNKIVIMFYCFSWKGRRLKQTTKVTFNLQHGRPIYLTSPTCLLFNETNEEGCILWQLVHLLSANCLMVQREPSQKRRDGLCDGASAHDAWLLSLVRWFRWDSPMCKMGRCTAQTQVMEMVSS